MHIIISMGKLKIEYIVNIMFQISRYNARFLNKYIYAYIANMNNIEYYRNYYRYISPYIA